MKAPDLRFVKACTRHYLYTRQCSSGYTANYPAPNGPFRQAEPTALELSRLGHSRALVSQNMSGGDQATHAGAEQEFDQWEPGKRKELGG